jgi:hypothetical protein
MLVSSSNCDGRKAQALAVVLLMGALLGCSDDAANNETNAVAANAEAPDACAGMQVTGRDYGIVEQAVMRTSPDGTAAPISQPGKPDGDKDAEVFAMVDGSVPIREECRSDSWSNIRVLAPEYLRWKRGWVRSSSLRRLEVGSEGRQIYKAADIEWQPGSERYRNQIVKVANAIQRGDKRCEAVDTASLQVTPSSGAPSLTIFCVGPSGTYPIEFTPNDASNGRSFVEAAVGRQDGEGSSTISKADAVSACKAATLPKFARPDAADYHIFTDVMFVETQNGARVKIGVTAKNFAGVEVPAAAFCEFKGAQLTSAAVEQ